MANKYEHLAKASRENRTKQTGHWVKGCISKKQLSSRLAGLIIEREKDNIKLYKYYCNVCDSYHLTRSPQ